MNDLAKAVGIGNAVTDNGQTVAERWGPQMKKMAIEGKYPSALPQFRSEK